MVERRRLRGRFPQPTPDQVQVFTFTNWGLLALDALLGLALLRGQWRRAQTLG